MHFQNRDIVYFITLVLLICTLAVSVDSYVITGDYRCPEGMRWFIYKCFPCDIYEELSDQQC